MRLLELSCENFRCITGIRLVPGAGINVIRGKNAQGKTSLLEALLYASTSKSHRTRTDAELVRAGKKRFRVLARAQRTDREVAIEAVWWEGAKRFKVNGIAQTRLSDILGKINVVFFSPEDVGIVRGSASQRRAFLDMELSQISPRYLYALQQYRLVLRQRNELLRRPTPDTAQLDAWDTQLVTHGVVLMQEREQFLAELRPRALAGYQAIASDEPLEIEYRPDAKSADALADVIASSRRSDLKQGVTTHGPHRDDMEFTLAGTSARQMASQGQQKTAALALKLAELDLVRARTGEYPILMLDDVFSELDATRAERLARSLPSDAQCFITTTDLADRDDLFPNGCVRFTISSGGLVE
ncbi:MAG: DNA replication/repair protein RecF [Candidatus Hydrogenedentes bacterium]|nr:DNA replication/repair protein RecF [Candidatus Hydrogenedentota bacterium]